MFSRQSIMALRRSVSLSIALILAIICSLSNGNQHPIHQDQLDDIFSRVRLLIDRFPAESFERAFALEKVIVIYSFHGDNYARTFLRDPAFMISRA